MIDTIIDALEWAVPIGAVAAIVIYFVQIALRPRAIRVINAAGLFFTGLALAGMAPLLHKLPPNAAFVGVMTTFALLLSVYFQGAASLRGRKEDRRADRRTEAEAVAS